MHVNKVSLAILVDDKALYEKDGKVFIPYGTNYKVLIKNNNPFDIIANISLDTNFSNDSFLIKAKSKRIVKGFSHDDKFYGFRFVESMKEIETKRMSELLNGTISISLFENKPNDLLGLRINDNKPFESTKINPFNPLIPMFPDHSNPPNKFSFDKNDVDFYQNTKKDDSFSKGDSINKILLNSDSLSFEKSKGVNVFGEPVDENANVERYSNINLLGSVFYTFLGEDNNSNTIIKPVFAKDNIECTACGSKSKPKDKYCSKCGSFIVITDSVVEETNKKNICCGKEISEDFKFCPYCAEPTL